MNSPTTRQNRERRISAGLFLKEIFAEDFQTLSLLRPVFENLDL
jgi:hypothetical protein